MKLVGLKTCSTCKAIEKQLITRGISYTYQDVRKDGVSADQLNEWYQSYSDRTSATMKKMVNTSGNSYKEKKLKDSWDSMSLIEQMALMSEDGMLIKRPILITDEGDVYVGREVESYIANN